MVYSQLREDLMVMKTIKKKNQHGLMFNIREYVKTGVSVLTSVF